METLQIKRSDAIKAHEEAKDSGKKLLENLFGAKVFKRDVIERIKTMADVYEELDINPEEFWSNYSGLSDDEHALIELKLITKALNEDWTPDWNNSSQYKWAPWFNMSSGFGFSDSFCAYTYAHTHLGSRLCFKSERLANYAGKQFEDIYKEFLIINQ